MNCRPLTWTLHLAASLALVATVAAQESTDAQRSSGMTDRGLAWLVEHQSEDGSWAAGALDASTAQNVGVTALALLAFMGDGHTLRSGPHKETVMRGVKWLRAQQDPETGLFGDQIGHTFLYDHGIATLAVCEAYHFSKSPILRQTAQRGVNYIAQVRNPYGAWRYDVPPVGDNDTSVTSWMVQALLVAQDAKLKIDKEAFVGAFSWFDEVTDQTTGRVGYDSPGSVSSRIVGVNDQFPADQYEAMTSAVVYLRALHGTLDREQPLVRKQADLILRKLPDHDPDAFKCDYYAWYYGSNAMHQIGGQHARAWRAALLAALAEGQGEDGSWAPVGAWGAEGGRVMTTALACLSLEAPTRHSNGAELLAATPGVVLTNPPANPLARRGVTPARRATTEREPHTEQQVTTALRWLARHQSASGRWDVDEFMRKNAGTPTDCDGAGIATQDVGVTSLALLAFLGDGHTLRAGEHRQVVANAIKWLRDAQQPDSGLIGESLGHTFHYDHAIATLALCTAYAQTNSALLRKNAQRALNYIARARNPYGVWRYDMPPVGDNDTSITSWMAQALVAGQRAGLRVDPRALEDTLAWLDQVTDEKTGRIGYSSKGSLSARVPGVNDMYPQDRAEALTGAGLYCRLLLGQEPSNEPVLEQHARLLRQSLPTWATDGLGNDMYAWYYGTHAMQGMGGEHAKVWRAALLEAATAGYRADGDYAGSWDPVGPWGAWGGRVYATALMALCLEAPYRLSFSIAPDGQIEEEIEEEPIIQDFEISDHNETPPPPPPPVMRNDGEPVVDAKHYATNNARNGALEWLARNQGSDGSWNVSDESELIHQEGVTALATLALMESGSSMREGTWKPQITRAIEWLVSRQDESGRVGAQEGHTWLYEHGIATLALCEAYAQTKSPLLKAPAQRAVNYVVEARNPYGAWRYDVPPSGDNDTSVTGWMLNALHSARAAGLKVPDAAFAGARNWIDEVSDPATGRAGYDSMGSRSSRVVGKNDTFPADRGEAMTAVALYCRHLLGEQPDAQSMMAKHAELLLKILPEWDPEGLGVDMYYWYFGTRALRRQGGKEWRAWREALTEALLEVQRADGDAAGSFDPIGPWGYAGGRAYSTALMALCLGESLRDK